jgi:hypothetical protein
MDIANDKIPVSDNFIFIPSSKSLRLRTSNDYFTYSLQIPYINNDFTLFMNTLIPSSHHQSILRNHITQSLISNIHLRKYITINGSESSVNSLFDILSILSPLIKRSKPSLYCESYVNKSTLDDVNKSRIVLCNINYRTIRIAQLKPNKNYKLSLQYSGIIYQGNYNQSIHNSITLQPIENVVYPTPGEVLGWIFS